MTDIRNAELRIVGGHPALNLVNTVAPRGTTGAATEYLASGADLLSWAVRTGVLDEAEARAERQAWRRSPATAAQALGAVLDLREASYAVLSALLAGGEAGAALERLALRRAAAAARTALVLDPTAAAVRMVVGVAPGWVVPDRLAEHAVELLRTVEVGRLRVCPTAEGGCGWIFLDHSRNGSRRWCSMEDCGAQAKARRLTSRRRHQRATSKTGNSGRQG